MKIRRRKVFAGLLGLVSGAGTIGLSQRAAAQSPQEIEVRTPEEFFRAIGSNRTIKLVSSHYNLSQLSPELSWSNARMEEVMDGYELVIFGVDNLTIEGAGSNPALIIIDATSKKVMHFRNSQNITIKNVEAGYWPKKQDGEIFHFVSCKNVKIEKSILFGGNYNGLKATHVQNIQLINSTVKECNYSIFFLQNVIKLQAINCDFYNNGFSEYSAYMIFVNRGEEIIFQNCNFYNNNITLPSGSFFVNGAATITVQNSSITNNRFNNLSSHPDSLILVQTRVENNEQTIPLIEDLRQILYNQIDLAWTNFPSFKQTLSYHVAVNYQGQILLYTSGPEEFNYLYEVPISSLVVPPKNGNVILEPVIYFLVLFRPDATFEVSHLPNGLLW